MTIAISLKVNDGIVLAADSASTLISRSAQGHASVLNVYNHANKIFNLKKGLPIGAITWGSGSIGPAAISTLAKDLRRRLAGDDAAHADWAINPNNYTIQGVADKLREFIFTELYVPAFRDWPEKPDLGFTVAGYSSGETMAEEFRIEIVNGTCGPPQSLRNRADTGVAWSGEPEAISRLLLGFGTRLPVILEQNLGVPHDQIAPAIQVIQQALTAPLVMAAMPLQDAIELAEFLVDLTIKFSRFTPGPPTVGGPIEVAAISKHEGFKWIKRKHYFSRELNPEGLS